VVTNKVTISWDVTLCNAIEVYQTTPRHMGRSYVYIYIMYLMTSLHGLVCFIHALMIIRSHPGRIKCYDHALLRCDTVQRRLTEDRDLRIHRCEHLKSQAKYLLPLILNMLQIMLLVNHCYDYCFILWNNLVLTHKYCPRRIKPQKVGPLTYLQLFTYKQYFAYSV
jgi:hypothetical protein